MDKETLEKVLLGNPNAMVYWAYIHIILSTGPQTRFDFKLSRKLQQRFPHGTSKASFSLFGLKPSDDWGSSKR